MDRITKDAALQIAENIFGKNRWQCERLSGGGRNFCFKIASDKHAYVLRIADWGDLENLQSGFAWHTLLSGVTPVMPYLDHEFDKEKTPLPWLLMDFSDGDDIIKIYDQLISEEKSSLSKEIFDIQNNAETTLDLYDNRQGTTDKAGFFRSVGDPWGDSWRDFIINSFRSKMKQLELGKIDKDWDDLAQKATALMEAFSNKGGFDIRPKRFLWDIGDRNVLVRNGKIVAIIDVDGVGLGDRLMAPALAWVTIGQRWNDFNYADAWSELECGDDEAKARLEGYKIFWILWFSTKYGKLSSNGSPQNLNYDRLKSMLLQTIKAMTIRTHGAADHD